MGNIVLVLLFVAVFLMPLAAGIWAYTRSGRAPLLAIPIVLIFLPLAGSITYVVIADLSGTGAPFWVQRLPGLIALLVVVVLVRRLEVESP